MLSYNVCYGSVHGDGCICIGALHWVQHLLMCVWLLLHTWKLHCVLLLDNQTVGDASQLSIQCSSTQ
jgi:hypothetical protein